MELNVLTETTLNNETKRKKKCCSLWLDIKEWEDFQQNTARIYGKKKSASDRINEFLKNENLKDTGKSPELSIEDALADAKQKLQSSFAISTRLRKIWCPDVRIGSALVCFALSQCGIPRNPKVAYDSAYLITQIEARPQLFFKLSNLKIKPEHRIDDYTFEIFIEYLEEKIKQGVLKNKLVELRHKRQNIDFVRMAEVSSPLENAVTAKEEAETEELTEEEEPEEESRGSTSDSDTPE